MNEFEQRMLRLYGKQPTWRDRWQCFYRLWRMVKRDNPYRENAAADCFRVFFFHTGWVQLVNAEPLTSRKGIPIFLRRRMLERDRRRRLHGHHPEWAERDQAVARMVRDRYGMEMTPDEVAVIRRKIINIARENAPGLGITLPRDDEALLRLLKKPAGG